METQSISAPLVACSVPCADPERVATARAQLVDESTYGELAEIFRALGDPTVRSRSSGKQVFHSLDDAHIAILVQAGLSHARDGDAGHPEIERPLGQFTSAAAGEQ